MARPDQHSRFIVPHARPSCLRFGRLRDGRKLASFCNAAPTAGPDGEVMRTATATDVRALAQQADGQRRNV
jgi:hypothetical protein